MDSWTSARVQQRSAKQANRNRPLKERVQPKSFAGENSTRASTSMMNAFENNMSSRAVNSGHRPSLNNMNLGRQGGALPQYVQTSVQNAITTQIRGADIKIDTKEIADAIRQQMSTQFQNIMNGNTRGDKKNIRVELRDNRNRAQHVNVPVADLQTAYAKSNPVAVQMMQTTNAIGFAKTVSGANSTSEVNRVLNSFRAEVHQAVAHVQSGGDIEKFKGIERIERLYPELKSLSSNMKKFEQIGKMLSETGSPLTLEQMAKFFEDSSRNIRPSTPK